MWLIGLKMLWLRSVCCPAVQSVGCKGLCGLCEQVCSHTSTPHSTHTSRLEHIAHLIYAALVEPHSIIFHSNSMGVASSSSDLFSTCCFVFMSHRQSSWIQQGVHSIRTYYMEKAQSCNKRSSRSRLERKLHGPPLFGVNKERHRPVYQECKCRQYKVEHPQVMHMTGYGP